MLLSLAYQCHDIIINDSTYLGTICDKLHNYHIAHPNISLFIVENEETKVEIKEMGNLVNSYTIVLNKPSIISTLHETGHIIHHNILTIIKTLKIGENLYDRFIKELIGKDIMTQEELNNPELFACRFSVWTFKTMYPRSYEQLVWKGHLLVRPDGKEGQQLCKNPRTSSLPSPDQVSTSTSEGGTMVNGKCTSPEKEPSPTDLMMKVLRSEDR